MQIFIQWKKKIHDGEAATLQENDRNVISLMLFKLSGVSSKKENLQQQVKCRIINQSDLWSSLLVRDKYFRGRSPSGAARSYSVESLSSPCSVAWRLHTARNKNVTRSRQSISLLDFCLQRLVQVSLSPPPFPFPKFGLAEESICGPGSLGIATSVKMHCKYP